MADIRQSTAFLDDFNRADENPLSGGGNWAQTDTALGPAMRLLTNKATSPSGQTISSSYWVPLALDGDDAEAWGHPVNGGANGIAWGLGLFKDLGGSSLVDGYRFRIDVSSSGGFYTLGRYDNGVRTAIQANVAGAPTGGTGLLLIRRNGNDVEGWQAANTDGSDFTLRISGTDTTYTTGLHPALSISDNSGGSILQWDWFGGGPAEEFVPQIYRRVYG